MKEFETFYHWPLYANLKWLNIWFWSNRKRSIEKSLEIEKKRKMPNETIAVHKCEHQRDIKWSPRVKKTTKQTKWREEKNRSRFTQFSIYLHFALARFQVEIERVSCLSLPLLPFQRPLSLLASIDRHQRRPNCNSQCNNSRFYFHCLFHISPLDAWTLCEWDAQHVTFEQSETDGSVSRSLHLPVSLFISRLHFVVEIESIAIESHCVNCNGCAFGI